MSGCVVYRDGFVALGSLIDAFLVGGGTLGISGGGGEVTFVLALDQGTTGTTAMAVDSEGRVLGKANREFSQHFVRPGWVEHDLEDIWSSTLGAMADLWALGVDPGACACIGITNQRETTGVWDHRGRPAARAIVWQDRRTARRCEALRDSGEEERLRRLTGLVADPYFSATKLEWLLQEGGLLSRAESLCFGTMDTWLLYRLTAGRVHATDVSNASRTLLFDIHRMGWSSELCDLFQVPEGMLPEVRDNSGVLGHTRGVPGLADGIPISGMAGDQQAALFGQACFSAGEGKCTYGTGAFFLTHVGERPVSSEHGLLSTVAWRLDGKTAYALEGSSFIAGAAVHWFRDGLGLIDSSAEIETLARGVDHSDGVTFVPALSGLGAPHWDPSARGAFLGLTRGTRRAHMARAVLDGVAMRIAELSECMAKDAGQPLRRLRVDGGAAANDLLMQRQADVLGVVVDRPQVIETTALGAAYLSGLAVGLFSGMEELRSHHRVERSFEPRLDDSGRRDLLTAWQRAIAAVRSYGEG